MIAGFRWDHWLCAILLGGMAVISFVNILGRYLFHYSLSFTEEVTINLFVWLTVVGTGIAFERCSHLGMVTAFNRFPVKLRKAAIIINSLLSAVLFLVVNVILVQTIYREITLFKATSPALGIPKWIYYAGVTLLSPCVFIGVHRGVKKAMSEAEARR